MKNFNYALTFLLLFLNQSNYSATSYIHEYEYCVVGAGPAGLQMAYFLQKSNRNYILLERNNISG